MSTVCSIAAYGQAKATGTILTKKEQVIDILKTMMIPLAILEIKDLMYNSNAPTKKRTDIDSTVSQMHLDCELDIVGTKKINGRDQSLYAIPTVQYKESDAVLRRLKHKQDLLSNTQAIVNELTTEYGRLVAQGK